MESRSVRSFSTLIGVHGSHTDKGKVSDKECKECSSFDLNSSSTGRTSSLVIKCSYRNFHYCNMVSSRRNCRSLYTSYRMFIHCRSLSSKYCKLCPFDNFRHCLVCESRYQSSSSTRQPYRNRTCSGNGNSNFLTRFISTSVVTIRHSANGYVIMSTDSATWCCIRELDASYIESCSFGVSSHIVVRGMHKEEAVRVANREFIDAMANVIAINERAAYSGGIRRRVIDVVDAEAAGCNSEGWNKQRFFVTFVWNTDRSCVSTVQSEHVPTRIVDCKHRAEDVGMWQEVPHVCSLTVVEQSCDHHTDHHVQQSELYGIQGQAHCHRVSTLGASKNKHSLFVMDTQSGLNIVYADEEVPRVSSTTHIFSQTLEIIGFIPLVLMSMISLLAYFYTDLICCKSRQNTLQRARVIGRRRYKVRSKRKHKLARSKRFICIMVCLFLITCFRIGEASHPGPRHRTHEKHNYMIIATANKNCLSSLTPYLANTMAQVVCGQEIHKRGKAFWQCKKSLSKGTYIHSTDGSSTHAQKWRAEGAQAVDGPNGGTSGGVLILTKQQLDIAPPMVLGRDDKSTRNKYEVIPGHLTAVIINGWFGTRILILDVYMDQHDGTGLKNRAIMMMIGILTETMGIPFVVAGDMNMTPQKMADTGWVDSIMGKIVATEEATCRPTAAHTGRVLDYFVISDWLAPLVHSIELVQNDAYQPHCVVELTLSVAAKEVYENRAKKPLGFPEDRPIRPRDQPVIDWTNTPYDLSLNDHAKWWARRMEDEMASIYGIREDLDEPNDRAMYTGRAEGFVLQRTKINSGKKADGHCRSSTLLSRLGYQLHDLAVEVTRTCAENTGRERITRLTRGICNSVFLLKKVSKSLDFIEELVERFHSEQDFDLHDVVVFNMWAYYCDVNAKQHDIDEAQQRTNAYRKFLDKAIKHKNAQIIHAMIKPQPDVISRAVETKCGITTTNQAHADEQIGIWEKHWEVGNHEDDTDWVDDHIDYTEWREPTQHEIDDVRDTCRSFKMNTAVAYDNLRPKQCAQLTDKALAELIKLYWRCEALGRWPDIWRMATMVMIPKAEEGKWRLIAMLVAPYRIWARHCNKIIAKWIRTLDRSWTAYGPGCSAEGTTYEAALEAERHTGRYTDTVITAIGDLEKGFEKVIHGRLRHAAEVHRFPKRILEFALNMYKSERRIRCGTAYSRAVKTNMGVLAGCPIAMAALLLACIDPVHYFLRSGPRNLSVFKVYVDDFSLTFTFGGCNYNADHMAEVVEDTYRKLDALLGEAGLLLSYDKNKSVTNNTDVAARLVKRMSNIKMKTADQIVKLGVDYAAGKPVMYTKAKERLKKAQSKRNAIMSYCKGGWRIFNVVRAHVVSAAMYGATVHGVPPQQLLKIRTIMRSTTSTKAVGGSTTIVLALQRDRYADPAFRATLAPIQEWAIRVNRASYENNVPVLKQMSQAWEAHKRVLMTATDPWQHVCGPASATMATLIGIGWKPLSYKVWISDMKETLDLVNAIPYVVKQKINDAVERRLWHASSLAIDDEEHWTPAACDEKDRPYWYPLRCVVLGNDKRVGGAARSVAANTQWTQQRLATTNYVDEDNYLCRACGLSAGTLTHRHEPNGCRAMEPYRFEVLGEEAIKYYDVKKPPFLVRHGIMMRRELPECPSANATEDQIKVLYTDRELVFSGFTYVDGSGKACRYVPPLGRAGYGVVDMGSPSRNSGLAADEDEEEKPDPTEPPPCGCHNRNNLYHVCTEYCAGENNTHTDNNGVVTAWRCNKSCTAPKLKQPPPKFKAVQAVYGPLVGFFQTTPRAELQAMIVALKYGRSPQTIVSDHRNHVIAINRLDTDSGRRKVLDMKGPMLDLWRQVIDILRSRGGLKDTDGLDQLRVIWQKAHLRANRSETPMQKQLRRGNDNADIAANWGREMHPSVDNQVTRAKYLFDRACEWAKWVGFAAAKQYENDHACDHDLKQDTFRRSNGVMCTLPTLPKEAMVIRRFPWASRSLGTVEHRELQRESEGSDNTVGYNHPAGLARRARVAAEMERNTRAYRVKRFCEKFQTAAQGRGARVIPQNFIPEKDEWVPTTLTLGHAMNTVGLFPEQFLWCEKCGAHTNERARALKSQCKNRQGNQHVADKLARGVHPYNGTPLATGTRRLTLEDVGYVPDGAVHLGDDTDPSSLEELAVPLSF